MLQWLYIVTLARSDGGVRSVKWFRSVIQTVPGLVNQVRRLNSLERSVDVKSLFISHKVKSCHDTMYVVPASEFGLYGVQSPKPVLVTGNQVSSAGHF